jgi:hypothetical protein
MSVAGSLKTLACLCALFLPACVSVGPATIVRDRLDYGEALAEAAKREMLLNIVKLRFGDTPSLTSVEHIVAGYSVEGRLDLGTDLFGEGIWWRGSDLAVGAGGTFSDRPTITYNPIRGSAYARTMMAPLPPNELIAMLTSGLPANETLALAVKSINGLGRGAGASPDEAERYLEALGLIEALRTEEVIGIRFEGYPDARNAFLLVDGADGAADPRLRRLMRLLRLDPSLRSYRIVFGLGEHRADQIALYTRSLIEILGALADEIEVPEPLVASGQTYPARAGYGDGTGGMPFRVGWTPDRPVSSFVAVEYEGGWYSIGRRDLASKRIFGVLMLLAAVMERPGPSPQPVITIPAG